MPTYVYKFIDTGETIEVQQSFADDALTEAVHPRTGAVMPVKKIITPVGVTFKGGGFYKTDSRSGSKSKAGSNGSGTSTESSSSTAGSEGSSSTSTGSNGSGASATGAGSSTSSAPSSSAT